MVVEYEAFEHSNMDKINKSKFSELYFIPATSSSSEEIKQLKSDLSEIKQLLTQNQPKPNYNKSQYIWRQEQHGMFFL